MDAMYDPFAGGLRDVKIPSLTASAQGGTAAAVSLVAGTGGAYNFNFTIPKGDKGDTGAQGPKGDPGDSANLAQGVGISFSVSGGTTKISANIFGSNSISVDVNPVDNSLELSLNADVSGGLTYDPTSGFGIRTGAGLESVYDPTTEETSLCVVFAGTVDVNAGTASNKAVNPAMLAYAFAQRGTVIVENNNFAPEVTLSPGTVTVCTTPVELLELDYSASAGDTRECAVIFTCGVTTTNPSGDFKLWGGTTYSTLKIINDLEAEANKSYVITIQYGMLVMAEWTEGSAV